MPTSKPPVLQVLWEPWPDTDEGAWERDGREAFAGTYWLDALEADGTFKPYGYRARLSGCTQCRRSDADPRAHWLVLNDMEGAKRSRSCPTWKTLEAVVKTFGGWKRVHYVELEAHEGLTWQGLQGRARNCWKCGGEWLSIGWTSHCEVCRGFNVPAIGPKRDDRMFVPDHQKRVRA